MAETTLAKAVSSFAEAPNDLKSHLAIEAALKETYAREILEGGRFREQLHPAGMRYTIEFANGQSVSVVISNTTDEVIERTYTDRGDIHADEVMRCLRGWVKSVKQAQHGGRPKGTGKPKYDPAGLLKQLAKSGLSERDFEREFGKSRSTIRRAKRRQRNLASDNR